MTKMNVSFAGCGFLGIYHVGVACCFKKYAPHLLVDKIAGASAGAIAACSLICDLPMDEMISDVLRVVHDARKRTLGPFSPNFDVQGLLLEGLDRFLPHDAHKLVSGKLFVSLTRAYDLKNVIVSEFNTRDELLQALLASSWVPIFSGILPPKFRNVRYMDGGLSDNLPTLDENTITVSPFCGESDICPRDTSSQLFHVHLANTSIELSRQNVSRFTRILFPPDPERLAGLCKQGFDDSLRYLQRHNMIACMRCLSIQSTYVDTSTDDDSCEYDPECQDCRIHRQEAMVAKVPEPVMSAFQEAIDAANKGIINWVFNCRGVKLLSIAVVPYILPMEIAYATCHKMVYLAPVLIRTVFEFIESQLGHLVGILQSLDQQRREVSNNIICQLDISQFGDVNLGLDESLLMKNHLNLQFKVHGERVKTIGEKILSRRNSLHVAKADESAVDAVDNVLKVTQQHEALLAFYYMDGENKVKVTQIFEVTPAESDSIFVHSNESENNSTILSNSDDRDDLSCTDSSEDCGHEDNENIFSDPESEWKHKNDEKPEAEQETRERKSSFKVMT